MEDGTSAIPLFMYFLAISLAIPNNITSTCNKLFACLTLIHTDVQVFVTQLSGVTPFESVELNEEYEDANCSTSPAQSNICPGPIL